MCKKISYLFLFLLICVLFSAQVCEAYSTYNYRNFDTLISQLKRDWLIPDTKGTTYTQDDYTKSYAEINWFSWNSFDTAKDFVLSMNVSWRSASSTPNTFNSGCGLVFRENGNSDYLYASLRMDGRLYFQGARNGRNLSYGDYYYGRYSLEATHNLTIIANDTNVNILVDGKQLANVRDVAINRSGWMGFSVSSGTNKDFGTWCQFTNVHYYVW